MRITFGVGIGFDRHDCPILPADAERLKHDAVEYLAREFGGVFVVGGFGGWIDDSGKLVTEAGLQFIVETKGDNWIWEAKTRQAGNVLRELFNQTSVIVGSSPTSVSYSQRSLSHA